jgi:hypothetical protein
MTAVTRITRRARSRAAAGVLLAVLALAGCKSSGKDTPGTGAGRGKDPLVAGPNLIPRQNVPVPERGIGSKGKSDPLLGSPTGKAGDKVGYSDDPERFKGTFIPGKPSTPASLAGRIRDGEELKIESPGVKLQPASGTLPVIAPDPGEGVDPLFTQLERFGVKREDRTLEQENGRWVFRASVPISGSGARLQYTGEASTAPAAVKQVLDQIAADRK